MPVSLRSAPEKDGHHPDPSRRAVRPGAGGTGGPGAHRGQVAAGSPILAQECIEDYLTFHTGHPGGRSLRPAGPGRIHAERGNSPRRSGGGAAQQTCNQGEIVVAMIDDEATVKRFSRKNGHIWLLPENDDYEPIDGTYAQILGKVVAVVRQY